MMVFDSTWTHDELLTAARCQLGIGYTVYNGVPLMFLCERSEAGTPILLALFSELAAVRLAKDLLQVVTEELSRFADAETREPPPR